VSLISAQTEGGIVGIMRSTFTNRIFSSISSLFFATSSMNLLPRARSDPGPPEIHNEWPRSPTYPQKVAIRKVPQINPLRDGQSPASEHSHSSSYSSSRTHSTRPHRKRTWFKRIIMAPIEALENLIKKRWTPSENTIICIRTTYYILVIVGAIISIITTLTPFC
jgi:hypothetical protein